MDLAIEVQPMIQTPDHSSYPSGHACEAFAVASVLCRMMGAEPLAVLKDPKEPRHTLFRLAARIAENRTVAGVHFPMDNLAGAMLGIVLGELVWGILPKDDETNQTIQIVSKIAPYLKESRKPEDQHYGDDFTLSNLNDAIKRVDGTTPTHPVISSQVLKGFRQSLPAQPPV